MATPTSTKTEIWLKPISAPSTGDGGYRKLIAADSKHAWPMWSPDGKSLLFMSDKSGSENLWEADATTGSAKQLTHFTSGPCSLAHRPPMTAILSSSSAILKSGSSTPAPARPSRCTSRCAACRPVRTSSTPPSTAGAVSRSLPDGRKLAVVRPWRNLRRRFC